MSSEKIGSQHVARKAMLYVRQSSLHQVAHHQESRRLQYSMRQHLESLGWQEVEVLPDPLGKPLVHLSGRAQALAKQQGLSTWAISLSHGRDYAVAFVVASGQ